MTQPDTGRREDQETGMPTRSELVKILKRLLAAKKSSAELDQAIWCMENGAEQIDIDYDPFPRYYARFQKTLREISAKDITPASGSIDAARAVVERMLPGTMVASGSMEGGPFCRLVIPIAGAGWAYAESVEQDGGAQTEPTAILAALVEALIARETVDA